jgi:hypothetical protein
MTIGGFRVSEAQFKALCRLQEEGRVVRNVINYQTAQSLVKLGLAESFVPDAETYAMAARGRVRYYRLTKAGFEAARGLKKLYKQEPAAAISPSQPIRRVRQRIVDT